VSPTGLDLDGLRSFLDRVCPGLVAGDLSGELIQGGKSNLTYAVTDGTTNWVVRRPPLGHVLSTAHDMTREFSVMSALSDTPVPVPRMIALCEDAAVLGAPFYVMEYVHGTVYRTAREVAALGHDRAHELSLSVMDVMADLHSVDPAAVGLGDFGRPEGYLERQVRRWRTQLDSSRSRELPGIDELHAGLAQHVPPASGVAIVHGDYRLDNMIVGEADRIVAVLDWEMATLGDPLADLGLSLVYWGLWLDPVGGGLFGKPPEAGSLPTPDDLAARYARRGGLDRAARSAGSRGGLARDARSSVSRPVDPDGLGWYLAFAYFKIAVILEGIYYRHQAGQTVGAGFDHVGAMVPLLVERGVLALRAAGLAAAGRGTSSSTSREA
jgi:aminoglycoside phosphotransferase (APT) family kinase protein